jgi:mobilome CxxCx(11)CxxC protein
MAIQSEERRNCHDSALRCFGTAYIFECRAAPLRVALKLLAFSSLIGPLSIGSLVLAVGLSSKLIPWAIAIAAFLSVVQITLSLWSLVSHWQENLSYYLKSKADNYRLADQFVGLGNNTIFPDNKWRTEFSVLEALGSNRTQLDLRNDITDEEKRMGMRAALREYQRSCASCHQVPRSLEALDCPTCGNFKKRRLKWLM